MFLQPKKETIPIRTKAEKGEYFQVHLSEWNFDDSSALLRSFSFPVKTSLFIFIVC